MVVATLGLAILGALSPPAAAGLNIGVLECAVREGVGLITMERERLTCTYTPDSGQPQAYTGTINKFGLAVGVTAGTVIVWGVYPKRAGYTRLLVGQYVRVSAETSAGLGVVANALVGGPNRALALMPLSFHGQVGFDIAGGITDMELHAR